LLSVCYYRLIPDTVFNPDMGERFTSFLNHPDRPWGPPSLLFCGYRVSFLGKKRQGRDSPSSPLSGAEVKNERSYTFTSSVEWRNFFNLVVVFNFFFNLLCCYDPSTWSFLRRLSKLVKCFFGTQQLRIAHLRSPPD